MRQRFFCQNCKKVLEFDQTVPSKSYLIDDPSDPKYNIQTPIIDESARNCKVCGHAVLPNNFSEGNKQYATSDPYKAAALFCMGAELKETDISDPQNVVFIFTTHDKMIDGEPAIVRFNRDYHSARLVTYCIDASKLLAKHQEFMKLIRENRVNAKYAKRQGGSDERTS